MRTWDLFYPDVLPDVLGCPEPTVDRHLVNAARRFCQETYCWRADLDPIMVDAGFADYTITYPRALQADGVTLLGASLNGQEIGLDVPDATPMALRRKGNYGGRRVRTVDLRNLTLMPTPGAYGELVLEAVLQPTQDAEGVPNHVGDQFRQHIATGALSTLLVANKAPWANPQLAAIKSTQFEAAIAKVKSRVWRGFSNARPRSRAQFY